MSWPFTRAARGSRRDADTLYVSAGDGADGTGGPDAARHGGPVMATSDRTHGRTHGERHLTLTNLLGLDPAQYPDDAHVDLPGAQLVDLEDHGLISDLAGYFAGVEDPVPAGDTEAGSWPRRAADVWDAWPVEARTFAEATAAAERFTFEEATLATAPPWSSRVDAAVHGMDAVDPQGMDAWMQAHADSPTPHLFEARLVAAWESRQDTASDTPTHTTTVDETTATEAAGATETEPGAAVDDMPVVEDDGDVAEDGW